MKRILTLFMALPLFLAAVPVFAQGGKAVSGSGPRADGYYKDIFMDGGCSLNSYPDLPAADWLGLSLEQLSTAERLLMTSVDTLMQNYLLVGNPLDENGALLYPDGAPRFRVVYVNGGKALGHTKSLTAEGRERFRTYLKNGGSYLGTCAGAFMVAQGAVRDTGYVPRPEYLCTWPGWVVGTGLETSATGMTVEPGSPLLKYYDFGGDMQIDSVRHNGGCYAYMEENVPAGTEVLLRYIGDTLKLKKCIHQKVSAWAWKESEQTGRIVAIGSHPERMVEGDRLELMAALIRYAIDGNGLPRLKGVLANGVAREMIRSTGDNNPDFTRIGDRQYHHFAVDVPRGVKEIEVELKAPDKLTDRYDLWLFADGQDFAFRDRARYKNVHHGTDKKFTIPVSKPGRYYISVFCATAPDTVDTFYGVQYTGRTDVLNGVPYSIKVSW
ncbi:MAG: hypothetical protein IJK90_05365 [Bacteroidales bacterium]|nr:hypothetical protein [Bacteroidales bacterium]